MKRSGLLKKQQTRDQVNREVASETERQYMVDLICLVLNDPRIMGKDTFGAKRLQRIVEGLNKAYAEWYDALTKSDEADYYRAKLDDQLRAILGDKLVPFDERYRWIRPDTIAGRRR